MVHDHTRLFALGTFLITVMLLAGMTVFVDCLSAAPVSNISQLQADAKDGCVPQEIELAAAYFTGTGVQKDEKQAAYWYQKAAESGDAEAANEIGLFYQAGIGVPTDSARAMHWYQLAAASGFTRAKVNLGVMYVWGVGVPKNETLAAQLFEEAASRGDGTGASYLGDLYYFGMGVKQNPAVAERWYRTGVKLHDPIAAYNLATLLSVEANHSHDLRKAATLLRQSAAAGYVQAMHSLGLLLVNHPEWAISQQEAVSMLEAAADAGSWRSSVVLGVLSRDGKGVPKDNKAAYYHFRTAILQGGEPAVRLVRNDVSILSEKLDARQMEVLDSDANTWFQQHHIVLLFVYRDGEKSGRFPASALAASLNGLHANQPLFAPSS